MVRPWHTLPREAVGCPILAGVQELVGWGPRQPDPLGGSPAHGWNWMSFEISSNPSCSVIVTVSDHHHPYVYIHMQVAHLQQNP